MVTPHHPSWKRAHSAEEGHSREALCVFRAAQLEQQVREQASQVAVGVRHHGTVMRRKWELSLRVRPRPSRSLYPTTPMPLPLIPHPCPAPGQQQDTLQVGVGSHQSSPASSLLHARDHHAAAIPSEQGLQGLHCAAVGGAADEWAVRARRALAQPSLPPVCTPHLAWLYGSPWWDGAQTSGMSVGHGSRASSCSCATSTGEDAGRSPAWHPRSRTQPASPQGHEWPMEQGAHSGSDTADRARTKPLCSRDVMDGCDSGESLLPPNP